MKTMKLIKLPIVGAIAVLCLAAVAPAHATNITPKLIGFKQSGPLTFSVVTSWTIAEAPPKGYIVFTHICAPYATDNGDIITQADSGIDTPDKWKVGTTLTSSLITVQLPASAKDGTYLYKVGMFDPSGGDRLELRGNEDGETRYSLGKIIVADGGKTLTSPGTPPITPSMLGITDLTGSVINFKQDGPRAGEFQLVYDVKSAVPAGYETFVHITLLNPDPQHDNIMPVGPSTPDTPSESWAVGQKHTTPVIKFQLPDNMPDGVYSVRFGFWIPSKGGGRLQLSGKDDGNLRYVVGTITLSGNGSKVEFKP